MKIEDYKKADCSLFRLPPIDASVVGSAIEVALVKAWENGSSVNSIIENVLNDKKILKQVTEQISENLEFQKVTALRNIDEKKKESIRSYETEGEAKLQQIQESLGNVISEKETGLKKVSQQLSERHSNYNASQKKLEEMRIRIQEKLKGIGGEEGFETLLSIQGLVKKQDKAQSVPQYNNKDEQSYAKEPIYDLGKVIKAVTSEEKINPLEGKTLEAVVEKAEEDKKKHGKVYRFFKKVWRVLNYEL